MRTYVNFSMKSFSSSLAYRSQVWLQLLGNFVTILIQVAIWKAVIGAGTVGGITLDQMITYSIINTLILSILLHHVSGRVDSSLKSGGIAAELVRPMSYPLYLFAHEMGDTLYQFTFVVIPSLIIAWVFFGIQAPASAGHAIAFVIALVIVLLLSFLIGYLISLIAFWFLTHFALDWTLGGLMLVFSGSFLPLWFFPDTWANIAEAMPFQYLGYIPAAIYMGYIPVEELLYTLMVGSCWIAGIWVFAQLLWWRAIRRLVVHGG